MPQKHSFATYFSLENSEVPFIVDVRAQDSFPCGKNARGRGLSTRATG